MPETVPPVGKQPSQPEESRLNSIRQRFRAELPDRILELGDLWNTWLSQRAPGNLEKLKQVAHQIAGTSGSLGFVTLAPQASRLEELLDAIQPERTDREVQRLLREMLASLDSPHPDSPAPPKSPGVSRPIILLEPEDPSQVTRLLLERHGHDVRTFTSPAGLSRALGHLIPAALLVDINLPDGSFIPTEWVTEILDQLRERPEVFLIADHDDLVTRGHAARMEGSGLFFRPLDPTIIEEIDATVTARAAGPYRVLVVDDSRLRAENTRSVLQARGMSVETVDREAEVFATISRFRPDLLLLESDLKQLDGMQLGWAIRQQADLQTIPILIVSEDMALRSRMVGTSLECDGFLSRPFPAAVLPERAAQWARRYRILRAKSARDRLTGLLTRQGIRDRLDLELARAERAMEPLAYVRFDLEGLSELNRWSGPQTGDLAIQSFARILEGRLRHTDAVGRLTGGRFAALLPNSTGLHAGKVAEEIQEAFVRQHGDANDGVRLTVSAGIAVFPHYHDAATLRYGADRALQDSKVRGGHRAVIRNSRGSTGYRVLVVDDDPHITALLEMALESRGHEVLTAHDGSQCLKLIERAKPELAIIDILLPYVSGFDLCRRIKEQPDAASVILMTGVYRRYRYRTEALGAGADDFFLKPLHMEEMLQRVDALLAARGVSGEERLVGEMGG